ncbi:MAG: flavodoxin/ferredoxin-dependent (E)-4-hydroxy-3-methylbut-2-enyl-diphosphate synthase, partial [Clostridiales bacterium]
TAGLPIRIGVNGGSLEKDLLAKYGGITPQAMVESALHHVSLLEKEGFENIKISLKSSSLPLMVDAYRLIAKEVDYPLHIGLTEAGTVRRGSIRSAMAMAILLSEGIGDTIRVSLTGDPLEEVRTAKEILAALGLYRRGFQFISCPTCGRTAIEVEKIALKVENALENIEPPRPMKIAVMGCVVNGPGEAGDADIGIAGGKNEGLLFVKGQIVGKYPNHLLADILISKVKEMIKEENIIKENIIKENIIKENIIKENSIK